MQLKKYYKIGALINFINLMSDYLSYANRLLDIVIRCSECTNTRALHSFKMSEMDKLVCGNCNSKKFKAFLPFRYKEFQEKTSVMSTEIYRDLDCLKFYKNSLNTSLVPDFVTGFVNTKDSMKTAPYTWNEFKKLPFVLYADSSEACDQCGDIFTQITLKEDEILDSLNYFREMRQSWIQSQLLYCKCYLIEQEQKEDKEQQENFYKDIIKEQFKMLTKEEIAELGYYDESPLQRWDEETEEWTSEDSSYF